MGSNAHRKRLGASLLAIAAAWNAPAVASCVPSPDTAIVCTGIETGGVVGTDIRIENGATVRLDDPYAGASPRLNTVIVTSMEPSYPGTVRGYLIAQPNSQIIAPEIEGASAVSTGEVISAIFSGTIQATARNASGIRAGVFTSVAVLEDALVDVRGNGSASLDQSSAAGIILAGHYAAASVRGTVRTTGSFAPGITTLAAGPFGAAAADGLVLVSGGQIQTLGSNSPAVILAGGSQFGITGGSIATGGASSNGLLLVAGPGNIVNMEVAAPGVISARYGAAIGGIGTGTFIENSGTIQSGRNVGIQLSGDYRDIVTNSGWIAGFLEPGAGSGLAVDLGGGDDVFNNSGLVTGGIDLGDGDDTLLLSGDWEITGAVNGGAGDDDGVTVTGTGTPSAPVPMDLSRFSGFETLDFIGGSALVGDLSFGKIATYQPLFVRPGSRIAGDILIAGGGGALTMQGSIVGNVELYGDLAMGASRGTLSVDGDVLLGSGSTVTLTMTPTTSDALIVDGRISIDGNATLIITGERPLTPGQTYTLVSASEGIEGSFAAIEKADTVLGRLFTTDTAVQLLSTFQLRTASDRQAARTLGYINSLLVEGDAPVGLVQGVLATLDGEGYADPRILRTLSPEAYASAVQIGVENGFAIAASLREGQANGESSGPYSFGEAFGSWRTLRTNAGKGAAPASTRAGGVLSGIGMAQDGLSLGAFVGYSDARQSLRGSAATTKSDGALFGATARFVRDGLELGGSLIFDRSKGSTRRPLFTSEEAKGRYTLHGTTFDAYVGQSIALADGWALGPRIGVTQISVKRGNLQESSGGELALEVAPQRYRATFLSGEVKLSIGEGNGTGASFLAAGARHRIHGDGILAQSRFVGVTEACSVPGVERQRTLGYARAGISAMLTPTIRWALSGESEVAGKGAGQFLRSEIRVAL